MRRYFIAGLLVWLPILGTFFVIKFIINLLDRTLYFIPYNYQPNQLLGVHIPGLGLVFTFIILTLTGLMVTNFIGKRLVKSWDNFIDGIPLIRSIHNAFKQTLKAVVGTNNESFNKVLLVEYPRRGAWSIAFKTSGNFSANQQQPEMTAIFVPTTPNPTSGFLIFVPEEDLIELDIPIEEALKMVISLGVVIPSNLQHTPTQANTTPPN